MTRGFLDRIGFVPQCHRVRAFWRTELSLRPSSAQPCRAKISHAQVIRSLVHCHHRSDHRTLLLALFVKGFTKGLLVECGVLMVSIKLILMAKKTAEIEQNLEQRLDRIEKLLSEESDRKAG